MIQKQILKHKEFLTLISGGLLVGALISYLQFSNESLTEILLIIASIIGVIPIGIQAFSALRVKVISIDLLVTIAVIGAFVIRNYEESAIVTFLFLFGSYLEKRTLSKTRNAIRELIDLSPQKATKDISNGEYVEVDIEDVKVGDILLVKSGSKIPVDGLVQSGQGYVNESSINGEATPSFKERNSFVYASTILENGTLHMVADKVGEETTFGRIIALVEEAQDSKSELQRFIDRFAQYYTPLVLAISTITLIVTKDIEMAITLLVLGCPGALVIGVPVSNVAGIGNGAKSGVLFKGSEVIKDLGQLDMVIFDKTGTLTVGKPQVLKMIEYNETNLKDRSYVSNIEKQSDHPLAKAIVDYLNDDEYYYVEQSTVIKGSGLSAVIDGQEVLIGNEKLLIDSGIALTNQVKTDIEKIKGNAYSLVCVVINRQLKFIFAIGDQIRENAKEEIINLKKLGIKETVVLSGDHQLSVEYITKKLGIDQGLGNLLPEDKANFIRKIQQTHKKVAFVGDGINDSPSLALADIGIAMGAGTDVAIETSDIVLMNNDLSKLTYSVGLAKAITNNMIQNIVIAVGVVVVLFLGVFFSNWMNMTIGMFVHEASILLVIINGMRLLTYRKKRRTL